MIMIIMVHVVFSTTVVQYLACIQSFVCAFAVTAATEDSRVTSGKLNK